MPFLTAGDPDIETTSRMLPVLERAGASICELGIAFSDPIADGPVIQASMSHALDGGVRPDHVFEMVAAQRDQLDLGLVAMVSYSIVNRMGDREFVRDAKQAGIDGFIIPDLPVEESSAFREVASGEGLTCSFLIAPTTPIERAEAVARACTGFVYVLSRAGLTGERTELPKDLPDRLQRLRQVTDVPLAVGFGIGTGDQVRQVVEVADAAIVGSAIMRRVADLRGDDQIVDHISRFVSDLATGLPST